jgi:hypothetical protein
MTIPHLAVRSIPLLAFFVLSLAPRLDAAELLKVGSTVPAIAANDQHEKPFQLGDDATWLLISFDMGTGKAANRFFEEKGAPYLPDHKAVYVANIHGMPGVGRMFALPKMRKYPHRIILADDEHLLDPFPREEDRVTVIKLGPGRVVESIVFWDPRKAAAPIE